MWFFAALIVVAMGGVAALAAGHGAPMTQVYDDRPDSTVPASGPLGAEDLRRVRFSLAVRGYRMSEVDALLERLAAERDHEREQTATFARPAVDEDGPVAEVGVPVATPGPLAPPEPDGGLTAP